MIKNEVKVERTFGKELNFDIYVFRPSFVQVEPLIKAAAALVGKTRYQRPAHCEEAPAITDCLTAIHYVLQASGIHIPLTYIGDMPRQLQSFSAWRPLKIEIRDARCGDIVFAKNKENEKLLSHVALIIGVDRIFHCSPKFGTAVVQSEKEFFSGYEQKLNFRKMVCYIDPRNKKLREQYAGKYISRIK